MTYVRIGITSAAAIASLTGRDIVDIALAMGDKDAKKIAYSMISVRLRLFGKLERLASEAEVLRDNPTEEARYSNKRGEFGRVLKEAFVEGMHEWNYDLMPRRGVTVNVGGLLEA